MGWVEDARGLETMGGEARERLGTLPVSDLTQGTVLFRPGESARGFVIVLSGRIDVFLTGPSGRDILLYTVEPGQSCVQSTLGLLGGDDYSAEAVATEDTRAVLVPRADFQALMAASSGFRTFVFAAFAARMQSMMHLLERVAFQRIESRLAQALLDLAQGGEVRATHQDLATRIGSAREVVSRRLDAMAREGMVSTERGVVHLVAPDALRRLAAAG